MRLYHLFALLIVLGLSSNSFAVTDTFTNPEDSYVRETSPTTNYGSENVLIADGVSQDPGNGNYGEIATMVKWDISSIPAEATVTGVSITFNYTDASSGPYNIYAQNIAWSEGTVNWNDLNSDVNPLGTIPSFTFGTTAIALNASGIALVQGWIDGTFPNNGFAIRTGGTNNGIDMDSKESTGTPPTLEVTYTVPPSGIETEIVTSATVSVPAGSASIARAECPTGKVVTGGGFSSPTNYFRTRRSYPSTKSSWEVMLFNTFSSTRSFTAYAVCVNGK